MALLYRRYRRFLLSLLIFGFVSVFLLVYQSRNHTPALIIYDGIVKNASFLRAYPTTRPIQVKLPPTTLKVDVKAPAPTAKNVENHPPEAVKVKAEQDKGVTNTSTSKDVSLNVTKKTLYPVTLYAPYLIENPTLCSSVPNLSILVIVHTAPKHFDRRANTRLTWTNETYFKHLGRVRVLFLLGRVKDETVQKDIEKEFVQYGDLLQGDFIDAYHNLTHKGVMAYKWIAERCRNAKLILKVDDDVTINMYDMLTDILPKYQNKTKQIFCNHILPGTMPIIRKNTSKWYVEETQFRGKSFYPRYCSGFTVIFTNDFIPALYRAAAVTPFFWVDDVYLYGLVPGKVPGIKYTGFKGYHHMLNGMKAIECYKNVTKTCKYLVAGGGKRETIEKIWMYMGKQYEARLMNNTTVIQADIPKPQNASAVNKDKVTVIQVKKKETDIKVQSNNNQTKT